MSSMSVNPASGSFSRVAACGCCIRLPSYGPASVRTRGARRPHGTLERRRLHLTRSGPGTQRPGPASAYSAGSAYQPVHAATVATVVEQRPCCSRYLRSRRQRDVGDRERRPRLRRLSAGTRRCCHRRADVTDRDAVPAAGAPFHFNDGSMPCKSSRSWPCTSGCRCTRSSPQSDALRRSDFAAASCARARAPRNCGMAIAIKMAMINTTTINSMRVKPSSASRRRETKRPNGLHWAGPFLEAICGSTAQCDPAVLQISAVTHP